MEAAADPWGIYVQIQGQGKPLLCSKIYKHITHATIVSTILKKIETLLPFLSHLVWNFAYCHLYNPNTLLFVHLAAHSDYRNGTIYLAVSLNSFFVNTQSERKGPW